MKVEINGPLVIWCLHGMHKWEAWAGYPRSIKAWFARKLGKEVKVCSHCNRITIGW